MMWDYIVFEVKSQSGFCVKDGSYWSYDYLVSMAMSPTLNVTYPTCTWMILANTSRNKTTEPHSQTATLNKNAHVWKKLCS